MTDIAAAIAAGDLSFLDDDQLHDWVIAQRWFGSKSREVASIGIGEAVALRAEPPLLVLAIVEARFGEGTHETYQLPLGVRQADEGWSQGVILEADGWTVYDGLADPAVGRELLHRMRQGDDVPVEDGSVRFRWAPSAAQGAAGSVEVRPVGVEQSNSSVVFGEALILKAFRRVEPGVNPELELLRFLSTRGFEHIAPLAGWYEVQGRRIDATLGVLQQYLAGARDGWELTLEGIATEPDELLERIRRLGGVTGELHSALGSEAEDAAFAPEEPSAEALGLLTAAIDEEIATTFASLPEDDALGAVAHRAEDLRDLVQEIATTGAVGLAIRTHGDYHLGQVLWANVGDWVVIDFEGEPARSLPERRRRRSPLRDLAGMTRSFAYVADASLLLNGVEPPAGWLDASRNAFLDGYLSAADERFLPPSRGGFDRLLSLFELEKLVYELRYEARNRPDWASIPVIGLLRLLGTPG